MKLPASERMKVSRRGRIGSPCITTSCSVWTANLRYPGHGVAASRTGFETVLPAWDRLALLPQYWRTVAFRPLTPAGSASRGTSASACDDITASFRFIAIDLGTRPSPVAHRVAGAAHQGSVVHVTAGRRYENSLVKTLLRSGLPDCGHRRRSFTPYRVHKSVTHYGRRQLQPWLALYSDFGLPIVQLSPGSP